MTVLNVDFMADALRNADATFVLSSAARRSRDLSASCRQRIGSVLAVCNRWGVWEYTHCSPIRIGRSVLRRHASQCGPRDTTATSRSGLLEPQLRIWTSSCVRNSPRRLAAVDVFPTGIRVRPWRSCRAPPHSGGNLRSAAACLRGAAPDGTSETPGHAAEAVHALSPKPPERVRDVVRVAERVLTRREALGGAGGLRPPPVSTPGAVEKPRKQVLPHPRRPRRWRRPESPGSRREFPASPCPG
jgi:hypothetical protein